MIGKSYYLRSELGAFLNILGSLLTGLTSLLKPGLSVFSLEFT